MFSPKEKLVLEETPKGSGPRAPPRAPKKTPQTPRQEVVQRGWGVGRLQVPPEPRGVHRVVEEGEVRPEGNVSDPKGFPLNAETPFCLGVSMLSGEQDSKTERLGRM